MVLAPKFASWMMQLNTEMARISRSGRGHDDMADAVIAGVANVAAMKRSGLPSLLSSGAGVSTSTSAGATQLPGYMASVQ